MRLRLVRGDVVEKGEEIGMVSISEFFVSKVVSVHVEMVANLRCLIA